MTGHVRAALLALSILVSTAATTLAGPRDDASAPVVETAMLSAPVRAAGPGTRPSLAKSADFAFEIVRPQRPDGRTLVLLHGSGGDESSLVDLAGRIAPNATLLGVRGRVVQDGRSRWYRRLSPVTFDQADIRAESEAFAGFLSRTAPGLGIDLERTVFLGYSNGANLIAATALLHPGLVRRAALLRPMAVLDQPPTPPLTGSSLLMIAGEADRTYAPFAPALEHLLERCGAAVDARVIASDHMIGEEDARIVAEWLAAAPAQ
jgi:phospholipase/carboxylesterase